jgi:hydroxymethylbilane synthase
VATALRGSCQVPLAVFADFNRDQLRIRALVGMPDGSRSVRAECSGPLSEVDRTSAAVAHELISQGADRIIAALI